MQYTLAKIKWKYAFIFQKSQITQATPPLVNRYSNFCPVTCPRSAPLGSLGLVLICLHYYIHQFSFPFSQYDMNAKAVSPVSASLGFSLCILGRGWPLTAFMNSTCLPSHHCIFTL